MSVKGAGTSASHVISIFESLPHLVSAFVLVFVFVVFLFFFFLNPAPNHHRAR